MILLQGPRARVASTLFHFDARECLDESGLYGLSYGRRIAAVLARPSRKHLVDQNGRLFPSPVGAMLPARFGAETAILLEAARPNLVASSEDASSWSNDGVSVSTNFLTAPNGLATMDLLTPSGLVSHARFIPVTFTGNGTKCASVFTALVGSQNSAISIYDATAGVHRHYVRITWTGGVPVLTTHLGAGTRYAVEGPFAGNTYRISFSADGIIAANTHFLYCYPDDIAGTFAAPFWGAQAENAAVPSSYIQTTGSTVARSADSCYFGLPAANPPRAMSIYVRGVERGTRFEPSAFLWQVSLANSSPRMHVNRTSGSTRMQFQTQNAAGTFSTVERAAGADTALGDVVEYRSVLGAGGGLNFGVALNNGSELVAPPVVGTPLDAAWSGSRLYLGGSGAGGMGLFAFSRFVIADGERSLSEMRELAGV